MDTEIANTILQQMGGGGRIRAMTGAKQFVAHPDGVAFRFPNRRGANHVKVQLTAADDYVVTFTRIAGAKCTVVEEAAGVYAEDLKPMFERVTGLYLSL